MLLKLDLSRSPTIGGGSVLTDEAKEFMQRYESYRDECVRTDKERFARYFADEK